MDKFTIELQPSVALIQQRLSQIFPEEFPNRAILVGEMASRMVSVCIYGDFLEGTKRFFRPSTIIRFSSEQLEKNSKEDRLAWAGKCQTRGFQPEGTQWYAENTRETLRDDLIKNRLLPIGIISKKPKVAPTSPAPIYQLSVEFAKLFDPSIDDEEELSSIILDWQRRFLDKGELRRMELLAKTKIAATGAGNIRVNLPTTGKSLLLAPGEASAITKCVCEKLAPRLFIEPIVIWISMSDEKEQAELSQEIKHFGLEIDKSTTLPDVLIIEGAKGEAMKIACIEVVHSDGPITEPRKDSLLDLALSHDIEEKNTFLISAFSDRSSASFKKRFGELAINTSTWFSSEPDVIMSLSNLKI